MRVLKGSLLIFEGLLSAATLYLLLLLGAAATQRSSPRLSRGNSGLSRFLILIPAHDEESCIEDALRSLWRLDYPRHCFDVLVIADNCSDDTAVLARRSGARVYERNDRSSSGKGHALAWALSRLMGEQDTADAVVFLDADCEVSSNLLTAIDSRLRGGARAVQVNYVVGNPGESWSSGLRYAAFALINTVRPLGKSRVALSCGLLGTGMAFTRDLLDRLPWDAISLAEDGEYHMRIVEAGERVVFVPEAVVCSPMPTSLGAARNQQLRWEGGRWDLVRRWTPRLLRSGLSYRDLSRVHTALEPLVPPQSLLAASNVILLGLSALLRSRAAVGLALANLVAQVGFILGGLVLVRAPVQVYRSLALAPILVIWKVALQFRILAGHGAQGWVRTERGTNAASPE